MMKELNFIGVFGKMIVEYKRDNNSIYGDRVIQKFSEKLYTKYGAGFGEKNLKSSINLFKFFKKSSPANFFKNVSWSHYQEIINSKDKKSIAFYLNEVKEKNLTKLELRDSIKSKSFERTIANQRAGSLKNQIERNLRDPLILNLKNKKRSEKELENEIIKNISVFKKEIGHNVMFYEQQYKINSNGLIYKVDIVLYDKDNKCFILIDLKINKISQKDISQMKFYIEYFNKYIKDDTDLNTIGLILVETKDVRVETRNDIYQIKYLNEMPKEKELLKIINENKIILLKTENLKIGIVKS